MPQIKIWKYIWKLAAGLTVILLLAAVGTAFFQSWVTNVCFALGVLAAWASIIAHQKMVIFDTRTIVKQELRGSRLAQPTVTKPQASLSTKGIDEAVKRLEKSASALNKGPEPLVRELHTKTVEEIRFLQAQISNLSNHRNSN